jgi:hypothetical protein
MQVFTGITGPKDKIEEQVNSGGGVRKGMSRPLELVSGEALVARG